MLSLNDSENYELPSVKYRYIKLRIKKNIKDVYDYLDCGV